MSTQLLEIQPRELKFTFELKKQSSCSVRLTNNTYQNVAFKVKTTSPKKYCVRPNVGVLMPQSTCEFTVTMQAQKAPPSDMMSKDKFLIQSTVVPIGTTDMDILPNIFSKDEGKYVEEVKLRVVLMSPAESPVLSPVLSPINGMFRQGPFSEAPVIKEPVFNKVEFVSALHTVSKDAESRMTKDQEFNAAKDVGLKPVPKEPVLSKVVSKDAESRMTKDQEINAAKDVELKQKKDVVNSQELKPESKPAIDAELMQLKQKKDVVNGQELKPESKPAIDAELMPDEDVPNGEELKPANDVEYMPAKVEELKPKNEVIYDEQPEPAKDAELPSADNVQFVTVRAMEELNLVGDIEEMKSKLNALELKLNKAESTISNLTAERRQSIQERKVLQEELAVLRRRTNVIRVHEGFPLLYVVMVAFISILLGYLFRESIC